VVSLRHGDYSSDEGEANFEVLSSSSLEDQEESTSLRWAEVLTAIQAFNPEVVAKSEASSAGRRSWAAATPAPSSQLVESPLIFEETEKALAKIRNTDFDGARLDADEMPDFPAAQKIGTFLACPKRGGMFKAPVKLSLLPKDKMRPSRHDLALAGRLEAMPKELAVPYKAMAAIQEMLARSLELTSVLDSLSLTLGKVFSDDFPDPSMPSEQALQLLLQAVDKLVQKLAGSLSGAYVNAILVQRDALLKRSSLHSALRSSLRAVPISSQGLFGSWAKLAVDESAKRTTDEAFAAIARQGKRSLPAQTFRNESFKRPRFAGSVSGRRDARPFKASDRSSGSGRGSRRPFKRAPAKKQSKGAYPQ
jgi:hypothetical protein